MGLEEANGPKGAQRKRSSKPMGSVMQKSENGPQQAQSNASKESKGIDGKPMSPKDEI